MPGRRRLFQRHDLWSLRTQGQCGSCWAFATIGSVEGVNAIATGSLVALSEQELVDCDRPGDDHGCEVRPADEL